MIVPMKKAAVCVRPKDAEQAARALRGLGVLHVEHQQTPAGKDVSSLKDDIGILDRVTAILSMPELRGKCGIRDVSLLPDWRFAAKHIVDSYTRIDHLEEYGMTLTAGIAEWTPWGDFDPASVRALADRGVFVRLYRIPARDVKKIPAGMTVVQVAVMHGMAYCAVISGEETVLPFKEIELPKTGLQEMKARVSENESIMATLRDTIRKHTCYTERFLQIREEFKRELEFHEALRGMGESAGITYIVGYVPVDAVPALSERAGKESWGILITDPADDDAVPTLVRNPRWVSIISPVFKLIEIVPGYRELDISLWFLIFVSIFFGMLIGDAGYGLVFFALTVYAQLRFGKRVRDKSIFYLFYVFSLFAVGWGLLTGTFFGQAWLPQWVKPLAPALRADKKVQEICFLIGAVHLSVAHVWRAIIKAPSLAALGDVGWISILWGGFFLARVLVLGEAFPPAAGPLFIAGALMVVFFSSPRKNILKSAGEGMGALALNFVNSFTDVVSYIRLFAVGLATVAVADSFNAMAKDVGFGSFLSGAVAALILLIGHGLNIVLGPMSVLVHGIRLNILEFCSHLDIKWSGFSYKPLREQ